MSDTPVAPADGDRLAKVIARAGLCSRRDAEGWIKDGRVSVNNAVIRTPAFNVSSKDEIKVDGRTLAERAGTRVWLYHKPAGLVVTEKDPEGRETVFEKLAAEGLPRVLSIGRLDINTEGLLLLTNDGGLKRVLELPATGWLRRYRVRAFGKVSQVQLDNLKNGIELEGIKYGPIEATLEREQGDNVWLLMALREGKNREVKNVLGSLGLVVNRLIRISYGPFQLGDLPIGGVETVKARVLKEQLGDRLASQAGVDFVSEMPLRGPREADAESPPRPDRPGRPDLARRPRPAKEPERPTGRPKKIHFDDGRAPTEFVAKTYGARKPRDDKGEGKPFGKDGDRPRRAAGDGPKRDFKSGPKPDFKDRPKRDYKDGPKRDFKSGARADFADRPKRDFAERPKRDFTAAPRSGPRSDPAARPKREYSKDGPKRDFTSGPKGDFKDRPKRAFGDGPKQPFKSGPKADFKPGPKRDFADRPKRDFKDGPRPDRKPSGPRPDRGADARPARAGAGHRIERSGRPPTERPSSPRSAGAGPRPPRPAGDRPARPAGDRPRTTRPAGDRPRGPRPTGSAPRKPGSAPRKPGSGPRPTGPRKPRT